MAVRHDVAVRSFMSNSNLRRATAFVLALTMVAGVAAARRDTARYDMYTRLTVPTAVLAPLAKALALDEDGKRLLAARHEAYATNVKTLSDAYFDQVQDAGARDRRRREDEVRMNPGGDAAQRRAELEQQFVDEGLHVAVAKALKEGGRAILDEMDLFVARFPEIAPGATPEALERAARIVRRGTLLQEETNAKAVVSDFGVPVDLHRLVEAASIEGGELHGIAERLAASGQPGDDSVDRVLYDYDLGIDDFCRARIAEMREPVTPERANPARHGTPEYDRFMKESAERQRKRFDQLTAATGRIAGLLDRVPDEAGRERWRIRVEAALAPILYRPRWSEDALPRWLAARTDLTDEQRAATTAILEAHARTLQDLRRAAFGFGVAAVRKDGTVGFPGMPDAEQHTARTEFWEKREAIIEEQGKATRAVRGVLAPEQVTALDAAVKDAQLRRPEDFDVLG